MTRRIATLTLLVTLATGCATARERYVSFPTQGQTQDRKVLDEVECEAIATIHKSSDASAAIAGGMIGVTIGAVSGAAMGAISGAVLQGMSAGSGSIAGLAIGGGIGLITGLLQGYTQNEQRYQRIYIACLSARGYTLGG